MGERFFRNLMLGHVEIEEIKEVFANLENWEMCKEKEPFPNNEDIVLHNRDKNVKVYFRELNNNLISCNILPLDINREVKCNTDTGKQAYEIKEDILFSLCQEINKVSLENIGQKICAIIPTLNE